MVGTEEEHPPSSVPILPAFEERGRGRYTNAQIRDILRYLLRDGILPSGTLSERGERQQRNYKYHKFLPDIVLEFEAKGVPVHADFRKRAFWKEWRRQNHSNLDPGILWPTTKDTKPRAKRRRSA